MTDASAPTSRAGAPLHVACAADARYLPHTATMLHSLLTVHEPGSVVVHFLHLSDLDAEQLRTLEQFEVAQGATWRPHVATAAQVHTLLAGDRYPAVVWLRIFLPAWNPELDRILYLDSDLVVRRPLWRLWSTPLGEHSVAAVTNPMHEAMWDHPERLGLGSRADYFNSGVMLMNLRRFRELDLTGRLTDYARTRPEHLHFADQCTLNAVCFRERLPLHPRWNVMSAFGNAGADVLDPQEVREAQSDPAIVHFEGDFTQKPWHYRCSHPFADLYRAHRAQTPWPLEELEGRTAANVIKKHLPKAMLTALRSLALSRGRS